MGRRRSRRAAWLGSFALLAAGTGAVAQTPPVDLPIDGAFVRGEGQIGRTSATVLGITQTSNRGVIDWRAFSIANGYQVDIDNGQGATLNRVLGGQISQIDGQLTATGSVYLMNPSGVIVGAGGRVLSNGNFVASTREMDVDAFMHGGPLLAAGRSSGDIVNNGEVVSKQGSVVMIARSVTNHGVIEAGQGRVTLAAADDVLLTTTDGQANSIFVSVGSGGGDITQDGRIQAAAVALKAAGGNIFALAGNREGLVQATGSETINGELWLTAPKGAVEVSGVLAARDAGGAGGDILINGRTVRLASSAVVSAAGTRGGEVIIGAEAFGTGANLADLTTVASGATILAGGPLEGGRIETSGKILDLGAAHISAEKGGQWLVDPDDLVIDALAASSLTTALNAGTNVSQSTTAGGVGGSGDITVAAPVIWTGAGGLTLNAYRDLAVNATISGGGAVTLVAGRDAMLAAPVSGTSVGVSAANLLTIGGAGRVSGTGDLTLVAGGAFINQRGADALSSSGGDWLVYSANPANDAVGGLIPDFYQYAAPFGTTPAAAGNGLFYSIAPSVGFTLGAVTRSYDGTTVAPLDDTNTTVNGLINNDSWTLDGVYGSKDAGTGLSVTASNFRATHNGIQVFGYAVPVPSVTVNTGAITRAVLGATIIGAPTKTYNGTTTASLAPANFSLSGVAAGETITVNGGASVAYDSANAGARIINAVFTAPNFTAGSGVNLNNYVLPTTATGAGLINQAPLRITSVTANNKVYDGTTLATLNTATAGVFGIVGSDDVSLVTSGAFGAFATKNAGTGIAVTASGFGLTGAAAANYTITPLTGLMADISRATLNILNVTVNNKVYDGTTTATVSASSAVVTGRIAGDDALVSAAGASINFATRNVGTAIPVGITGLSLVGADAGNYNVIQPAGAAGNITPAPLTAAIINNPTKTYDGLNTAVVGAGNYTLTGFVGGEGATVTQLAGATYASQNAGGWLITANLTPPDYVANAGTLLSNYTLPTLVTGMGTINPAPIAINIIGNPTKPYDGTPSASLGPFNFEALGFIAGEGVTVTETHGLYSSSDAGTRTVTADIDAGDLTPNAGTLLSNYIFPLQATGLGTITRITLGGYVIFADITGNPTKVYDGNTIANLTPADYTLSGFIQGEGATVTQTVGQYDSPNAGSRLVTALLAPADFTAFANTNLDNYTLPTEASGIGTILRANLTAAIIGNPTRVYNGATFTPLSAANYGFSGFVAGEGATVVSSVTGAYDAPDAGARTISAVFGSTSLIANGGTLLTNYNLPAGATGPGTITRAPLTITGVAALSRVYDTTTVAQLALGGAGLFGVVAGDNIVLNTSGAFATFATRNVGSNITVTANGFALNGTGLSNYELFQPTGLFANITPKDVSVLNIAASNKVYDATTSAILNVSSALLDGVFAGDAVGLDSATVSGLFQQSNVGTGLRVNASGFALTGGDAGNYSLSQPNYLTASITPAPLTGAILGNPTKIYDGTLEVSLTPANFSLAGFVGGQGASLTQAASSQYDLADAGARTVTATVVTSDFVANAGTDLSNYMLPTSITGPGTINRATLTAAIIGNPTRVYDNTTAAILAAGNYQLTGFVGLQGATVTRTAGLYDSDNAGGRTVTASLAGGDFIATGATNLANYVLPVTATGGGTITPANLSVINVLALNKVYDANTVAQLNNASAGLSGVFGADVVNLVSTSATGAFATKNVGTSIPVTATGYTIAGADAANYTVTQPIGLFADITRALIALAQVTRVYTAGVDVPTASGAYSLSGVFGGDNVFVDTSGISGFYANKNVGTGIGVTLAGVALGGTDGANYSINPTTTAAPIGVITPANLNIIGAQANDKVYDRTVLATLNNAATALSGLLGADDVTLVSAGSTGAFNDFNVGVDKSVTASGYTVTGGDAGNYILVQPLGLTADITPLQIFLTSVSRIYTGDLSLPTASSGYGFSGVISGDTVTANLAGVSGSYASKDVAGSLGGGVVTGGINVSLTGLALSGSSAGNYFIAPAVTAQPIGVISQKLLTAAIIGNPTKVYDRTTAALLGSLNFSISGFVAGEGATVTQTAGVYDSLNAGSRSVSSTLAGGDFTANGGTLLSNYILPTTASGAGAITPAPLTISGILATDRVYNGTTFDPLDVSSGALVGVIAGDTTALDSTAAFGTFADRNVGTNISVTAAGFALLNDPNGNYTLSQPTGLFADITQALLTVLSVTRVYTAGVELPTLSSAWVLGGFVAGDDVSLDASAVTGGYATKNVGSGISVNAAGYSLAGADAGNYSIASSLSGALIGVITPATVTLANVLADNKIYDGTTGLTLNNTGTTVVGTLLSDSIGVNSGGSSASFASPNVGIYSVAATGYVLTGADAGNYILTQPTGISASITPASLTALIIGNPSRTYNATTNAALTSANYALTGFITGEGATVTETAGTYNSANAGVRIVTAALDSGDFTANSGTLLSNYALPVIATGAGQINQAILAASIIGNPARAYDGTTVAVLVSGDYSLTGFIGGDGATVTETVGVYSNANAGSRTVTVALDATDFTADSGTLLANYVLPVSATGAGQINQALLTAGIIGNPTRVYNGGAVAGLVSANYVLTGFISGEGATVTETVGAYDSANAGARTVTAVLDAGDFTASGGTLLSNYILPVGASGAGQIDRALLTAAIVGNPARAYNGTATAVLTSANYALGGFVSGQGATVTETVGAYDTANAGLRSVTAALDVGDFTANGGTLLSNYILPVSAAGAGQINQAVLTAAIIGLPTRAYDATTAAFLTGANFALTGFVSGEGAAVTETSGVYASPNAGLRNVTTTLDSGDFAANSGTLLSNYVLPTSAAGAGVIQKADLGLIIVGDPTRTYNGAAGAVLGQANYQFTGFVAGQGATVMETVGTYNSVNAGLRTVTAALGSADFVADGGTLLTNYNLPTSATGLGHINPAALAAVIVGNPSRVYDGTATAVLSSANYALTGFIGAEGATVTRTVGTYDGVNAGLRVVTASLDAGDFAAGAGTLLSNYVLPVSAVGAGQITQALLTAAIVGNPTRFYNGTTASALGSANYTLAGFVAGESATVTETAGLYDSANAGSRTVTATLDSGDFTAGSSTLLSNYILPVTATGAGQIDQVTLTALIVGDPTRVYDGTTIAALAAANYTLTGFIAGEGASITETAGAYASANAGLRLVTADLGVSDFTANSGTLLSNYALPTSATGLGHITQASLAVALLGNPTRTYDGTSLALLTSANFAFTGFVAGEGATVTETAGLYDSVNAGSRTVTVSLDAADFAADGGTLLSNYVLPTSVTGAGQIDRASLTALLSGVSRAYDGTTNADLTPANYVLTGFVAGEGATVTETRGTFASANAGPRVVTADLGILDFTANSGTLLSNYVLPTGASGLGQITQAVLAALIIGDPNRVYDGTTVAALTSANYALTGFVAGEGASVTRTVGAYGSPNAGVRTVTAALATADFSADAGTLLSNYLLPTDATGLGHIDQATLTASLSGVSRAYDGTTVAALNPTNYTLTGFVTGEGATVTETQGTFASANAGLRRVTTDLDASDFTANSGTLLSNYVLPTGAGGLGQITQAVLAALIIGDPNRVYDGTTVAALTSANYALTGFVAGEGALVTETVGVYGSPNAGVRAVTAALDSGDFTATGGTLLSNYLLPTTATGLGRIDQATLTASLSGVSRAYDGTTIAALNPTNYTLAGFVAGEGATVTETQGTFASANAGLRRVTTDLGASDFTANSGTLLSNYVLPTSAGGLGQITQAVLAALIIGDPNRVYDGTTVAALTSANYALTGFVAGEGASVTRTVGAYGSPNAGVRTVTAALETADFSANAGTLLSNYLLPTDATGIGHITQALLTAAIIGDPTRPYDGTTGAVLNAANFTITGFISGEGATVTETAGVYDSRNAGSRIVTAALDADDLLGDSGTLLSNYILPVSAMGAGQIDRLALTAAIVGNPTRAYNGTSGAALNPANYALTGFAAGEGATVSETIGAYDSPNAGARTVTASLDGADFSATGGALLSNYILPTSATGAGQIDRADLIAAITGYPTRRYDGTTNAVLTSTDYTLTGFAPGEGASITETVGVYSAATVGVRTVTASLDAGDYLVSGGTLLSNYNLPTVASGLGEITAPPGSSCVIALQGGCLADAPQRFLVVGYSSVNPRFYVPYPADGLYVGHTNGFGGMPGVIVARAPASDDPDETVIDGGVPVLNSTEGVLLQGDSNKRWTIRFAPGLGSLAADGALP